MRTDLKQLPNRNDHYVGEDRRWLRTQTVQKSDGTTAPAIVLKQCEVDDPERFTYWDGGWWAIDKG